MLLFNFLDVPQLPFDDFKWKWASLQCTEGINDPVVLLGVLFRMAKLEGRYRYSSDEFANELISLSKDLVGTGVNVDLSRRVGERNLIRNSGQYWKALNLIPSNTHGGIIQLTQFGREVANHTISQTEFSALSIMNFKLPNPNIQTAEECRKWREAGIELYPLKLILSIVGLLGNGDVNSSDAYITPDELTKLVIPLSGTPNREASSYVEYIRAYRNKELDISKYPNCCRGANDFRIAREFLLFLSNYGYLNMIEGRDRASEKYCYNYAIDHEIQCILKAQGISIPSSAISDTERKRVSTQYRPNQAKFRKDVLSACKRCVVTNVDMPEVLEAAHIKPHKYNGEEILSNGFLMRLDIHYLFDLGHIRISVDGDVSVSDKVRMAYGASIPPRIFIPDYVNKDFIRWRWENYDGL